MNTLFSLLSSIDDFRLFTVVLDMYGGIHTYIHTGTYTRTHTHTHIQQYQAGRIVLESMAIYLKMLK